REASGAAGGIVGTGKAVMNTTTRARDASTTGRAARRADTGLVRLSQRDIDGLMLCGEHWGAPFDLLAAALRVPPDRLSAIPQPWRPAGYAARAPPAPR